MGLYLICSESLLSSLAIYILTLTLPTDDDLLSSRAWLGLDVLALSFGLCQCFGLVVVWRSRRRPFDRRFLFFVTSFTVQSISLALYTLVLIIDYVLHLRMCGGTESLKDKLCLAVSFLHLAAGTTLWLIWSILHAIEVVILWTSWHQVRPREHHPDNDDTTLVLDSPGPIQGWRPLRPFRG